MWARLTRRVIAGWWFSQPTCGIYMSGENVGLHGRYFPEPWQVVMILDPEKDTTGIFRWVDNAISACGFYLVETVDGDH